MVDVTQEKTPEEDKDVELHKDKIKTDEAGETEKPAEV
jgi:hypothetical protein